MQILYIIGDLSPNSIERQLVEIIQDFDNITQTEIYDGSQNIALADSVWFIVCGNIDNIKRIIQDNTSTFSEKICTLSGLGGVDGSIDKVRQVHSLLQSVNAKIIDDEVTIVPLTSERFECSNKYQLDLFWQKEGVLKAIGSIDKTREQQDALNKVVSNYFTLMKAIAVSKDKPSFVKIDYPNIQTDVGTFDILLNLPDELAELHYEIDALCDDNEITDEQIERALLELINRKW